jgi:HEPN domain-containing protein/predicted nucleotidyltransferase
MISESVLKEATDRLVFRFHPDKIILFGSQARGDATDHSDVDLMVLFRNIEKKHDLLVDMHRELAGIKINADIDIKATTSGEFELDRQIVGTIARPAAREGRILYDCIGIRKVCVLRKWISTAQNDLAIAKELLKYPDKTAFYAQQSIEKYLKAWLVYKEIDYPHSHSIKALLSFCMEHGGRKWAERLREAEKLTDYARLIEYPFEGEDITMADATRAIEIAELVELKLRAVLKYGIGKKYEKQSDEDIRREYEQIDLLEGT